MVNSQRATKHQVDYNHLYPTRANGITVLLKSSFKYKSTGHPVNMDTPKELMFLALLGFFKCQ